MLFRYTNTYNPPTHNAYVPILFMYEKIVVVGLALYENIILVGTYIERESVPILNSIQNANDDEEYFCSTQLLFIYFFF